MGQELRLVCHTTDQLPEIAKEILRFAENRKIFLFYAEMGVGKTTFIKALSACLGSKDSFSSPTYSLINEYSSPLGRIFHFDLYRLQSQQELYDLGIEEYLDSGAYCLVEWPEKIEQAIQEPHVKIKIENRENTRYFHALKT